MCYAFYHGSCQLKRSRKFKTDSILNFVLCLIRQWPVIENAYYSVLTF